jgi:hypothetical protein
LCTPRKLALCTPDRRSGHVARGPSLMSSRQRALPNGSLQHHARADGDVERRFPNGAPRPLAGRHGLGYVVDQVVHAAVASGIGTAATVAGMGHNSQWKTDFRRDYVTQDAQHFNVDGQIDVAGLTDGTGSPSDAEIRDLVRHRRLVRDSRRTAKIHPASSIVG